MTRTIATPSPLHRMSDLRAIADGKLAGGMSARRIHPRGERCILRVVTLRIILFASLALVACTSKARLLTETSQLGSTLEVKIDVDPPSEGTLTFSGNPAFEKLGPQKVTFARTL